MDCLAVVRWRILAGMAEQWISAAKALEIAKDSFALCERLYAGKILARASVLLTGDKREEECAIPRGFWWAMGHAALDQNWNVCDFSTWLEQKQHIQAYGVTMGLSGVLETVDFEKRALIARSLSVASNPDWISAREASRLSGQTTKPVNAGEPIMALARLGFVSGRAVLFEGYRQGGNETEVLWEQREWDIESWFWNEFTISGKSDQDWTLGKFSGRGEGPGGIHYVILSGVHFHRSFLSALDIQKAPLPEPEEMKRGRKPYYDWTAAISTIWGRLYRGDLLPQTQADIEIALISTLTKGEKSPNESTVRPYAKPIWEEFQKP